jgi:hypothetical protein
MITAVYTFSWAKSRLVQQFASEEAFERWLTRMREDDTFIFVERREA